VTPAAKPKPSPAKRGGKAVTPAKAKPKGPTAPVWLEEPTRNWWLRVVAKHDLLDEHHLRLLTLACEAWDRGQSARMKIAEEGATYKNRFGDPVAHPAVKIEHDARLDFVRILRELNLDAATLPETRPPRRGRKA
jgi:P27 family predicted phage terminase small subunit